MATASSGPGPAPPEPGHWTPAPSGPGCTALCLARILVLSPVPFLVLVLAASGGSPDRRTHEDSPADAKHQIEPFPQGLKRESEVLVDFKSTSLPSAAPFLLWSESASSLTLTPSPQLPSHSPEVWSSAVTSTGDIIYMICVCAWLCVRMCSTCVLCSCSSSMCSSRAFLVSPSSSRAPTSNMLSR